MPKGVPNKRYTPEFKRMVVETMKKEHLNIYATMQEFGINDHKIIERWERIYLEEGPESLSVERRGRSSTGRSKKLPKEVEEDLLADTKRKGAEVVFTTGGAQSNHAMLTAACAKKLGMEPILILKKRGVTERKATSCWSWTSRPRRRTSASSICAALATPSPLPRATPPSA
ncbi:hypothetical protein [Hominenteromicrobium sp.]|uniref:hypothetical protein n=1 Tax=Hominenteromicrobium sp. TaxID=3073581 RepID=UPI003AF09D92